jgi:hypothetical protein
VNLQSGVNAYLAEHGGGDGWFGFSGALHRPDESLLSMISLSAYGHMVAYGAATYGTAPIGPEQTMDVVTLGLVATTSPDGAPVIVGIRASQQFGPPSCSLEVLAASAGAATATRNEIDRLIGEHDTFRGNVLSFSASEFKGNELVNLLPRPAVVCQ